MKTKSKYAVRFDVTNPNWSMVDHEHNLMFLRHIQIMMNSRLAIQGYVFLRDIYEALYLPINRDSITFGWFVGKNAGFNIDHIKFDLDIAEDKSYIDIDFNVQGDITGYFK